MYTSAVVASLSRRALPSISALVLGCLSSISSGQMCRWESQWPGGPVGRYHSAAAFDSDRSVMVMFGGDPAFGQPLGDTWEWRDDEWVSVAIDGPTPRWGHAMAYDSRRGVTVLFGGTDATGPQQDTWEWDGARWTLVATNGPTARSSHSMAYDPQRGVTVLFGGSIDFHGVDDTWEWDGARWVQVATSGPSPRSSFPMTYNPDRGTVMLFGGNSNASSRDDLWEWNGIAWSLVTSGGPERRYAHGMAFDEDRGVLVVFGGVDSGSLRDTWIWTGAAWQRHLTPPPLDQPRFGFVMLYDPSRHAVLVYSGAPGYPEYPTDVSHLACASLRLYIDAPCPGGGAMRVGWTGATPRTRIALLYSPLSGRTFIPPGNRCEGTLLGLGSDVQAIAYSRSSINGKGSIMGQIASNMCGGRLQLLDPMFCATSDVEVIE